MGAYFAGGLWGLVFGVVVIAMISLLNPPPKAPVDRAVADATPENTLEIDSDPNIETGEGPAITAPAPTATAPSSPNAETPFDGDTPPETVDAPVSDTTPEIDTAEADVPEEAVQGQQEADASGDATADQTANAQDTAEDAGTDKAQDAPQNAATAADAPNTEADTQDTAQAEVTTPAPASPTVTVAPVVGAANVVTPVEPSESTSPGLQASIAPAPTTPVAPSVETPDSATPGALEAVETDPATAPDVSDTAVLETPEAAEVGNPVLAQGEAPVVSVAPPSRPVAPEDDTVAADLNTPIEEPAVTAEAPAAEEAPTEGADAPALVASEDSSPLTPQAPISPADPADSDAAPTGEEAQQTADAEADAPSAPVVSVLPGGSSNVRVNRLTGTDSEAEAATETATETPDVQGPPLPSDAPAVQQFAAPASNPNDLPEISVVLADDGSFDGAIAALAGLPFPVSVMINPSVEDAASRMRAYRAAGIEVGMQVNLPPAATASDVAVYFEAAFGAVPQAFAVLDTTGATQADSDVTQQTVSVLAEQGQGLITVPRGLNRAPRVAADAGVAAGVIFRDLDSEGQDARTIQRFMDQAAFRAAQTPGLLLLGQVRTETISALTRWGAESNRASQVAVVPASAAITGE